MIYACALAKSLKLANIEGVRQATLKEIIEKLPEDPSITKMEAIALTDQDVTSIQGKKLCGSLVRKHPNIIICYLYKSENNGKLIEAKENIHKQRLAKISPETVERAMSHFLSDAKITTDDVIKFTNDKAPEVEKGKKSGFFNLFKKSDSTPKQKAKPKHKNIGGAVGSANTTRNVPMGKRRKKERYIEEEDINDLPSELRESVIRNDTNDQSEIQSFSSDVSENEAIIVDNDPVDNSSTPMTSTGAGSFSNDDGEVYIANEPARTFEAPNDITPQRGGTAERLEAQMDKTGQFTGVPESLGLGNKAMPKPRKAELNLEKTNLNIPSFEERMSQMNIEDAYDYVASAMQKGTITRELLNEDTEFANCMLLLEQWDKEMGEIYRDPTKSAQTRWNEIRELAYKRTEKAGILNSKIANKVCQMISTITSTCERNVFSEIDEIRHGIATVVDAQVVNMRDEEVTKLIEERNKIADNLRNTLMTIIEIYKLMDANVEDILKSQSDGLPSNNSMVSNQLVFEKENFIPDNAAAIATRVLSDLKDGLVKFSQMEKHLQSLILDVFKLIDKDSTIIKEQEDRYKKLKAVRVEETVTITNVLKNVLRVFVGPSEAGTTATALTWAGLRARRQNTLLIDARPDNMRTVNYGESPMEAMDYLKRNERDHFRVLKLNSVTPMDIDELLGILETKTDYFSSINLIMDDTQVDLVNRCIDRALSINVITNSTVANIERTRGIIADLRPENVGLKIIAIDPVVERMEFIQSLSAQDSIFKLVNLPYMKDIRACGIRHEAPYKREAVATVFEEAFR